MKTFFFTLMSTSILFLSCKENKKESTVDQEKSMEANDTSENILLDKDVDSKIKITPIEHATAVLEWEDLTIYIDPVGGAEAFDGQNSPNLIFITDIHSDHLSTETLEAINTESAKIIVPQAVADKLPESFENQIEIMNNGESKEVDGFTVEAIAMYNLREEALKYHEKGRGNGYIFNMGDQRIYFSGDTEDIPEIRALKNIDKAFICMNLPYTMTPESAAEAVLEFKPKQVYPYHYRGKPDVTDVSIFKKLVNSGDSNIEVIQLDWYPNEDY